MKRRRPSRERDTHPVPGRPVPSPTATSSQTPLAAREVYTWSFRAGYSADPNKIGVLLVTEKESVITGEATREEDCRDP